MCPVEVKDHLMLAARGYLFQVVPPDLARVLAELVSALFLKFVPCANNVLGSKRLAIMPLDIGA